MIHRASPLTPVQTPSVTVEDVINNLQHPKIVEAFLLSPVFVTKLPTNVQLFLRPNYPVLGRADIDQAKLEGEKFTWAIVNERRGTNVASIAAGAIVNLAITDDEFDALDKATSASDFVSFFQDGAMHFRANGQDVGPKDPMYRVFTFALEGGAIAHAADLKVILSNGPRWLAVGVQGGRLTFSRTFGQRSDGKPIAADRPTTTMYGALVSNAFETVITRDAMASLEAARAAAGAR